MPVVETLWQDARRGGRALARTPAFCSSAVLTLALGIGANAAIFGVINAVLLRPLPYAEPERRVTIWSRWTSFDKTWLSDAEVLDYRARCRTLESVAAWATGQVNVTGDGEPVRVGVAQITANTFATLGAQPLLGRAFTEAEDLPGGEPVVILGHGLWQQRFGGDRAVLGSTMLVNGVSRRLVGVMPDGFRLPTDYHIDRAEPTELYLPLQIDPKNLSRGSHGFYGAASLARGATPAQATAELRTLTAVMAEEGLYPKAMQFSAFAVPVEQEIRGAIRPALLLLFSAVGFLLLIACANVANLLLARGEARSREMAIRTALGAGHGRLVRQLLIEGLVLAALGAIVGLPLAYAAIAAIASLDPAGIPRVSALALDARVIFFTVALALVTTLLFSLAPALRAIQVDLTESLKEGGHQGTAGLRRQRLRGALVVAEVAFAVMLLTGAGLTLRSVRALQQIDLGFDPSGVLTLRLSAPAATFDTPEKVIAFYQRVLERVRAVPGVTRAGLIRNLPLAQEIGDWGLDVEGFVESPGRNAKGDWQVVSDGAIETFGERLIRGRTFTAADTAASMPVAIVNETLARTYFAGGDPIGGRIRMGSASRPWLTVVGLVQDERHNGITGVVKEKFYVPHAQFTLASGSTARTMTIVARTDGDPLALVAGIRAAVRAIDPSLPVANVRTMEEVVEASMSTPRFTGFLLGVFAFLAVTLSAVGIYSVLAYLVSQRTHEIGIRMAVGAGAADVLATVLRRGVTPIVLGLVAGIMGSLVLARLMASLLYGVTPTDPVTFVAVPLALGLVALAASLVPAWRAMRVDPLIALRYE
jgi:putative ABC transport system permease protein